MRARSARVVRHRRIAIRGFTALLGAACLLGLGGAAASSVPQGLVAAYAFDENAGLTAADASGIGHGGARLPRRVVAL